MGVLGFLYFTKEKERFLSVMLLEIFPHFLYGETIVPGTAEGRNHYNEAPHSSKNPTGVLILPHSNQKL